MRGKEQLSELRHREIFIVVIITGVLIAFRTYLSLHDEGPTCFLDETLYRLNATAIFEMRKAAHAHYPPFYSLIVSPALLFEQWYPGMLIISSFCSSMIVPVTWYLARVLQLKNPVLPAVVAALLPMHAVYAKMLMSENLSVPLCVLAVALTLHAGKRLAICCGVLLGVLHLTKYLFFPAAMLLFGVWAVLCVYRQEGDSLPERIRKAGLPILLCLLSYLAVYGIWIGYGIASGFSVRNVFGFQITAITSGRFAESASSRSLFLWSVVYLCYAVLAWLPAWLMLGIWCANGKQVFRKTFTCMQQPVFVLILFMLLGGYVVLAVQHSFGASYNYPEPRYLIGRYLMHLSPLFIVFTFLVLEILQEGWQRVHRVRTAGVVLSIVSAALLARWILYDGGVFALPHWFANITFNSIDSYQVGSVKNLSALIMALIAMTIAIRVFRSQALAISLPWVLVSCLFLVQSTERAVREDRALHARELSGFLLPILPDLEKPVRVYLSGMSESAETIRHGLVFWGIPAKDVLLENVEKTGNIGEGSVLLVHGNIADCRMVHSYVLEGREYSICLAGAH